MTDVAKDWFKEHAIKLCFGVVFSLLIAHATVYGNRITGNSRAAEINREAIDSLKLWQASVTASRFTSADGLDLMKTINANQTALVERITVLEVMLANVQATINKQNSEKTP